VLSRGHNSISSIKGRSKRSCGFSSIESTGHRNLLSRVIDKQPAPATPHMNC